jgi:hypothetical protein
VVEKG